MGLDMAIYATPKGQWFGSQALASAAAIREGSDPDSWSAFDMPFPASKPDVLALLNRLGVKPSTARRAETSTDDTRYRVFCRGQFVGVTYAPDQATACKNIGAELVARPSFGD